MRILECLCIRRFDSISNLALEFKVANSTLRNDILILSCEYPIFTKRGKGGGVSVADGYKLGVKYMTTDEVELLEKICLELNGREQIIMRNIIKKFKRPVSV